MQFLSKLTMFKGRVFLLGGFSISLVIIITALNIATKRVSTFSNASSFRSISSSLFSANNTYIFTSPISAAADGESPIRITVILLNSQGLGVVGQKVSISSSSNLTFNHSDILSDGYGKAIFDSVSNTPGDYTIKVFVSDEPLKQEASVSFR